VRNRHALDRRAQLANASSRHDRSQSRGTLQLWWLSSVDYDAAGFFHRGDQRRLIERSKVRGSTTSREDAVFRQCFGRGECAGDLALRAMIVTSPSFSFTSALPKGIFIFTVGHRAAQVHQSFVSEKRSSILAF